MNSPSFLCVFEVIDIFLTFKVFGVILSSGVNFQFLTGIEIIFEVMHGLAMFEG